MKGSEYNALIERMLDLGKLISDLREKAQGDLDKKASADTVQNVLIATMAGLLSMKIDAVFELTCRIAYEIGLVSPAETETKEESQ